MYVVWNIYRHKNFLYEGNFLDKTRTSTSERGGRITTGHTVRRGVKGFVRTRKRFTDVNHFPCSSTAVVPKTRAEPRGAARFQKYRKY